MALARIRTISAAVDYIKSTDPETTIGEWYLRQLIKSGKLKCHRAGNRYLVDLDRLEEYLSNPPDDDEPTNPEYGKLRKIQPAGWR